MKDGNWEIGFGSGSLDELLSGESSARTLWFLAGYLKGLTDRGELQSDELQNGERRMVLEPDGDGSWRLRSMAMPRLDAAKDVEAVRLSDHPAP